MERRLTTMIAAAAVLIILFIFWDAFRPAPRPLDAGPATPAAVAGPPSAPTGTPAPRAQKQTGAPQTQAGGAGGPRRSGRRPRAVVYRAPRPLGNTAAHSGERLE